MTAAAGRDGDPDLPQLPELVLLHCWWYFYSYLQDTKAHVRKADQTTAVGNRLSCGLLGHRKGKSPLLTYVSASLV